MKPRLLDTPLDQNVLRRERDAAKPALEEIFRNVTDKSDRAVRIHDAVRVHHYKLQEVADHLGLHFTTISVIAKSKLCRFKNKALTPEISKSTRLVQKGLGHADLSTTMIHTHVYDAEVELAMRNLRNGET